MSKYKGESEWVSVWVSTSMRVSECVSVSEYDGECECESE